MTKEQAMGIIDNVFCDAHFHEYTTDQLKDDLADLFVDEITRIIDDLKKSVEEQATQLMDSINSFEVK